MAVSSAHRMTLAGHGGKVRGCTFSSNGHSLLTCSWDKTARIWDVRTGSSAIIGLHKFPVWGCAFTPAGYYAATSSWDCTIKIWQSDNLEYVKTLSGLFSGHRDFIYECCFAKEGTVLISCSKDKTIKIWNPKKGTCKRTLKGHLGAVLCCDATRPPIKLNIASGSRDNSVRIWSGKGDCLSVLSGHGGSVYGCKYSPLNDGTLATSSWDGSAKVWDTETSANTLCFLGHDRGVFACVFDQDARTLVTAGMDRTIRLWDCRSGEAIRALRGHTEVVYSVALSNTDMIASASGDHTAMLWDLRAASAPLVKFGEQASLVESSLLPLPEEDGDSDFNVAEQVEVEEEISKPQVEGGAAAVGEVAGGSEGGGDGQEEDRQLEPQSVVLRGLSSGAPASLANIFGHVQDLDKSTEKMPLLRRAMQNQGAMAKEEAPEEAGKADAKAALTVPVCSSEVDVHVPDAPCVTPPPPEGGKSPLPTEPLRQGTEADLLAPPGVLVHAVTPPGLKGIFNDPNASPGSRRGLSRTLRPKDSLSMSDAPVNLKLAALKQSRRGAMSPLRSGLRETTNPSPLANLFSPPTPRCEREPSLRMSLRESGLGKPGKRAFLVGNSVYKHLPGLCNSETNVEDLAVLLKGMGYEVETHFDMKRSSMEKHLSSFSEKVEAEDVVLFYYSGHALSYHGDGFLLPVSCRMVDACDYEDLDDFAFPVQTLLEMLTHKSGKTVNVLMFDTCVSCLKEALPSHPLMELALGPSDVDDEDKEFVFMLSNDVGFYSYVQQGDRNSPYTAAVIDVLSEEQSLPIEKVGSAVADRVTVQTGGKQQPVMYSTLADAFYL